MARSGVNILTRSAADIITSALRRARIIPVRQPVSSIDLQTGIEALNNMVAELRAQGWHLWKSDEYVLFLQQGKTDYQIGPTGDNAVFLDDLIQDALTVATVASDTQLTISDTSKFSGSDDVLDFNPTSSTSGWTTVDATLTSFDDELLNILNNDFDGYAQFDPIDTTPGTDYFFEIDVSVFTGSVELEVRSGVSITLITTQAVTVAGTQTVFFTATEASVILRIVNENDVGDTDVENFRLRETDTGETVGFRVDASLREFNSVTRVLSSTEIELKNLVVNVGAVNQSVLAFKNLPARPLKLRNYRSKDVLFDDEIPMNTWSRQQYMRQTNKLSQGLPTQAYYTPDLDDGRLFVWQTASDVNQVVLFTGDKPLELFVENADNPDFPAEWFNMLSWGLASELGPEYGIPTAQQQILELKAAQSKETASDWDEEQGSLLIGPDSDGRR